MPEAVPSIRLQAPDFTGSPSARVWHRICVTQYAQGSAASVIARQLRDEVLCPRRSRRTGGGRGGKLVRIQEPGSQGIQGRMRRQGCPGSFFNPLKKTPARMAGVFFQRARRVRLSRRSAAATREPHLRSEDQPPDSAAAKPRRSPGREHLCCAESRIPIRNGTCPTRSAGCRCCRSCRPGGRRSRTGCSRRRCPRTGARSRD